MGSVCRSFFFSLSAGPSKVQVSLGVGRPLKETGICRGVPALQVGDGDLRQGVELIGGVDPPPIRRALFVHLDDVALDGAASVSVGGDPAQSHAALRLVFNLGGAGGAGGGSMASLHSVGSQWGPTPAALQAAILNWYTDPSMSFSTVYCRPFTEGLVTGALLTRPQYTAPRSLFSSQ
ncbi:hypothetical protein F7725_002696 [Dissostichus mawsoni]|uniref:Uncharacterized protein n=1 Tax=Dissostichus mawsoni TaxID=36200 RepID=A0A7J5Y5C3_DISMA|nr:hypothetical protein F7725_002696 [Dissostichus mawsoni]